MATRRSARKEWAFSRTSCRQLCANRPCRQTHALQAGANGHRRRAHWPAALKIAVLTGLQSTGSYSGTPTQSVPARLPLLCDCRAVSLTHQFGPNGEGLCATPDSLRTGLLGDRQGHSAETTSLTRGCLQVVNCQTRARAVSGLSLECPTCRRTRTGDLLRCAQVPHSRVRSAASAGPRHRPRPLWQGALGRTELP